MTKLITTALSIGLLIGAAFAAWMLFSAPAPASAQSITVHKTPWCGCCIKWVDHLEENGFDVAVEETEDLAPVRARLGVPNQLMSCHTGEVAGYAVEGHVPADDIRRLLAEMPAARGISVPGMPAGSPGMEMGGRVDPYQVVLFGDQGMSVWASYPEEAGQ